MQKKAPLSVLIIVVLIAYFSSCAGKKRVAVQQSISQSMQQLEAGDFQKAIDSYNSASERYPLDKNLAASYAAAIEEIRRVGDGAMGRGNFREAETTYALLLKNFPSFKRFEKSLSFSEASLSSKIKNCRLAQGKKRARQSLQSGDYQKGIDAYRAALKEYPDDRALWADYFRLIEEISQVGDAAFAGKNYALAGKVYYALGKNLSSFSRFEKKPSFTKESLAARIAVCRSSLTNKGLEQYRQGNLTDAIATWKSVLVFDPDNTDVKKSVETASAQLKKLEKKK